MYVSITGNKGNQDVYINNPTAKITVKLLPVSTKNLGSIMIFWLSSPVTRLP